MIRRRLPLTIRKNAPTAAPPEDSASINKKKKPHQQERSVRHCSFQESSSKAKTTTKESNSRPTETIQTENDDSACRRSFPNYKNLSGKTTSSLHEKKGPNNRDDAASRQGSSSHEQHVNPHIRKDATTMSRKTSIVEKEQGPIRFVFATDIILPPSNHDMQRPISNHAYFNHLLHENADIYALTKDKPTQERMVQEMLQKVRVCGGRFLIPIVPSETPMWRLVSPENTVKYVHKFWSKIKQDVPNNPPNPEPNKRKAVPLQPQDTSRAKKSKSMAPQQPFPPGFPPPFANPFFPFFMPPPPFFVQPVLGAPNKTAACGKVGLYTGERLKDVNQKVDNYFRQTASSTNAGNAKSSSQNKNSANDDSIILETNHMDVFVGYTGVEYQDSGMPYGDWNFQRILLPHFEAYFTSMLGSPMHDFILKDVTSRVERVGGRFLRCLPLERSNVRPTWRVATSTETTNHIHAVFRCLDRECSQLGNVPDWKHKYLKRVEEDLPWLKQQRRNAASNTICTAHSSRQKPTLKAQPESSATATKESGNLSANPIANQSRTVPDVIELMDEEDDDVNDMECEEIHSPAVPQYFCTSRQHSLVRQGLLEENPTLHEYYREFFDYKSFAPKGHEQDFVWLVAPPKARDDSSSRSVVRGNFHRRCHKTKASKQGGQKEPSETPLVL